jgi:hypothetical protein
MASQVHKSHPLDTFFDKRTLVGMTSCGAEGDLAGGGGGGDGGCGGCYGLLVLHHGHPWFFFYYFPGGSRHQPWYRLVWLFEPLLEPLSDKEQIRIGRRTSKTGTTWRKASNRPGQLSGVPRFSQLF